jgi:hypothetical protein
VKDGSLLAAQNVPAVPAASPMTPPIAPPFTVALLRVWLAGAHSWIKGEYAYL